MTMADEENAAPQAGDEAEEQDSRRRQAIERWFIGRVFALVSCLMNCVRAHPRPYPLDRTRSDDCGRFIDVRSRGRRLSVLKGATHSLPVPYSSRFTHRSVLPNARHGDGPPVAIPRGGRGQHSRAHASCGGGGWHPLAEGGLSRGGLCGAHALLWLRASRFGGAHPGCANAHAIRRGEHASADG